MDRRRSQAAPARRNGEAARKEWMVVPAAGEARSGELGRRQIMEMTGLPARDLRVLDPLLAYPSAVLGRDSAIVINLEHVKAIVTADEVLVPKTGSPRLRAFLLELRTRLALPDASTNPASDRGGETEEVERDGPRPALTRAGSAKIMPFEFKVLELCLKHACRCIESEASALEKEAYPALDELTSKVNKMNLEHVRQIKSRLVELSARVQKVRDGLEHLLDNDMDMAEMYLTRKLASQRDELGRAGSSKHPASADHHKDIEEEHHGDESTESSHESSVYVKPDTEELEMLLEAYFVQVDGTLNRLCHLRNDVDDTEDCINIMLDKKQNQLLQMGVMLTTATVVVTAGIVVVSLFGMNIHIDLMQDPETPEIARIKNMKFWETTWGTVAGCVAVYLLAIYAGKKSKLLK